MAKSSLTPLIAVIGILSILGFAYCEEDSLTVEGSVYCDTCRILFPTDLSTPLAGATVTLSCRDRLGGDVTFTQEADTDENGHYKITVEGDHEEEICEVKLVKSSDNSCNEINTEINTARVLITSNNGIIETSRYVNPLGFLRNEPLTDCPELLKSMMLRPEMLLTAH
ncbi:hypothetical protein ACHQM5_011717 [Ranunculus cassubicifolius]